ncbi:MAG: cation:proton antiporter [Dehalococcoidales bacterium]|nr:cation:proton antiporter [Dehalococcoidales bacterium]
MSELDPIISIAILLAAALVGGMVAHRLRQAVVLGYLVVGVMVGPHALGLVGDLALVQATATIGVALLMFTLGLEISVSQLRETGKIGLAGGIVQIVATFALGLVAGIFFGWPLSQATLFGLIISLSSTAVCYKILAERGELDSVHGRIMIAILIVQDISVVVMAVAVPLIGSEIQGLPLAFAIALGKTVLFTGVAILAGLWVLPWLMGRVGGIRSRELFLLTILVLSLGAALGTQLLGLSAVFGAFLVGLVLRETIFAHQALAEITPLRDIFATLFFVSLGMLLSPSFLVSHWLTVLLVIAVIILIKFSVVGGLVRFFGFSWKIAVISGAGLLQIGEFGFILAQAGINAGVISEEFYSLILAGAIITMLLTPVSISLASRLSPKLPWASTILPLHQDPRALAPQLPESPPQVIIAGYGRIGQHIAQGLDDSGIPYTILDIDPERIAEARSNGRDCLYGDVSNPRVLAQLDLSRAGTLVITFPDPVAVVTTVKIARHTNPKLKIVARVHRTREAKLLTRLGDVELISPEYEASLEFIRRILITSGWSQNDIQETMSIVQRRRELARYSPEEI